MFIPVDDIADEWLPYGANTGNPAMLHSLLFSVIVVGLFGLPMSCDEPQPPAGMAELGQIVSQYNNAPESRTCLQ